MGRKQRYPDFIILHPSRGLLFLEVKDWKLENLKKLSKSRVELQTANGRITVANPIEQVRQCAYQVINQLEADSQLTNPAGPYQGKLKFPYGYGVVFANINRAQIDQALGENYTHLLPSHMLLCKDEMLDGLDPEDFQSRLWGIFNYNFQQKLSLPEIERLRWHLFPEIRIDATQDELPLVFPETDDTPQTTIPDMIKVMDLQQEQLARSLGGGHRVIHGVAGSGKTMILGFRAQQLAELMNKPVLVLCFNISLAARLRSFTSEKGLAGQVQVYHFHDWCGQQIKSYQCAIPKGTAPYWERQVQAVIGGVEQGLVPRAQYGAVLIDEGHDFEPEWLQLVTQMVDPETDALLLLYDDAQSIYKQKRAGLDFSLSSVGIKARGRTTILKLNYRNTREILDFAYRFAEEFISAADSDEDHIPVIAPESAGTSGPMPVFRPCGSQEEEQIYITQCVRKWLDDGLDAKDVAILVPSNAMASTLSARLQESGVDTLCMVGKDNKSAYDPHQSLVSILTLHSSKGLEFEQVILAGIDRIAYVAGELPDQVRLMYVAMTRAKTRLLITASRETVFTERLMDLVAP